MNWAARTPAAASLAILLPDLDPSLRIIAEPNARGAVGHALDGAAAHLAANPAAGRCGLRAGRAAGRLAGGVGVARPIPQQHAAAEDVVLLIILGRPDPLRLVGDTRLDVPAGGARGHRDVLRPVGVVVVVPPKVGRDRPAGVVEVLLLPAGRRLRAVLRSQPAAPRRGASVGQSLHLDAVAVPLAPAAAGFASRSGQQQIGRRVGAKTAAPLLGRQAVASDVRIDAHRVHRLAGARLDRCHERAVAEAPHLAVHAVDADHVVAVVRLAVERVRGVPAVAAADQLAVAVGVVRVVHDDRDLGAEAGAAGPVAAHADRAAGGHDAPLVVDGVTWEVDLELGMAVAAVLEAERFELVIAQAHGDIGDLHVPPQVAGSVLRAVDADEGAEAEVAVVAEVDGLLDLGKERDADVEGDVGVRAAGQAERELLRAALADVLVAQHRGVLQRAVAVAVEVRALRRALLELVERVLVVARVRRGVEGAASAEEVDAAKEQRLSRVRAHADLVDEVAPDLAAAAHADGRAQSLGRVVRPLLQVRVLLRAVADRALVDRVAAAGVAAVHCQRVDKALRSRRDALGLHLGALRQAALGAGALAEAENGGQARHVQRGAEREEVAVVVCGGQPCQRMCK